MLVSQVAFPEKTQINGKEKNHYYRDAFKFKVSRSNLEAKQVYHSVFGFLPTPIRWAMQIRNWLMKPLGFAASNTEMSLPLEDMEEGQKAGFLHIELVSATEVIAGAYEKNMDMWISVLKLSEQEFTVSTLVNLKTRSSKMYMLLIKPLHKMVAKYCIRCALKAGRI